MTTRHAGCSCGQLQLTIEGESARISMCHCLACQRRTGAVFSNQARLGRPVRPHKPGRKPAAHGNENAIGQAVEGSAAANTLLVAGDGSELVSCYRNSLNCKW